MLLLECKLYELQWFTVGIFSKYSKNVGVFTTTLFYNGRAIIYCHLGPTVVSFDHCRYIVDLGAWQSMGILHEVVHNTSGTQLLPTNAWNSKYATHCCVPILLTTFPHEPQRNVSIAAVRGAVRPSKSKRLSMGPLKLYRITSVFLRYKTECFPSKTMKNLDTFYKTDLNLFDCLGRVKLVL